MNGLDNTKLTQLLNKRSKGEIVDWLIEQADSNEELHRALVSFVAPEIGTQEIVSELNQIISQAWERVRESRKPWTLARPIAGDLEPVLATVDKLIERGDAVAAEKVLRRFVAAAEKGLGQVDDSSGFLGPLARDAVTLWGKAWGAIEPRDPAKLVTLVFEGVQDNDLGICDDMIRDFAPALGRDGLLMLKKKFTAAHRPKRKQQDLPDWRRDRPLHHLADVADALGDVDMYLDIYRQMGKEDVYAFPIARRLFDAGRPADALQYLDRASPNHSNFPEEKENPTSLRVKILKALGDSTQVEESLWHDFQTNLSSSSLDQLLEETPKGKQRALLKKALAAAESHTNRIAAAEFLLARGEAKRAAALIEAHPESFNGMFYDSLLHLAKALQGEYPGAGWILYRALLLSILEEKRTKGYGHAAKYLAKAGELAASTKLRKKHEQLLAQLETEHGRKSAFWKLVTK